ncbi:MarR family winged helix-turn-helix transcriptional regulator [Rhodococcus sp. IEGM 1354]|jgi:DNA-binding MarR family transcriptional regulator|uniref:MarR family winged helix-turn-helix transcriptional regulator n=1 Tax=Rhodococcus sp. IEGM 1354 TaxID=3047088 RepID=UPI0024B76123|nr:MarR family winged helix-turn-helix transcriptional regulator [Rhodococcus sp. IEGM 1354]MDI9930500.1 MarR family winged helix-turn-helix transcriptional regulator [Rhodococcus sp. IEGM 1354]
MTEPVAAVHQLRALTVELDLLGADFAQKHSLHPTDIRALICLLDADRAGTRATPGWLGGQLGLESASITALIDRMSKRDLVSREADPSDRRRVLLRVTAHASELGTTFFGPVIGRAVDELARFTPEQRATIDEFLMTMRAIVASTREQQTP